METAYATAPSMATAYAAEETAAAAPVDRRPHGEPIRVLYATDGSEASVAAAHLLALLPLPAGSAVKVLTVLDAPVWQVPESLKGAELEWARRVVATAEAGLSRSGVELDHTIVRGDPAVEILEAAETLNADLILVGSHGRTGFERVLLGSVAESVARHAGRPVLVARAPQDELRQVVLAVDGSAAADRAVEIAAGLPLPVETQVTVCHVVRPFTPLVGPEYAVNLDVMIAEVREQQRADAEALVARVARELERTGHCVKTAVCEGDPATEIAALAKAREADLVVVGARGHSALRALLVGSVTGRLLKNAPGSVLVVH